MAWLFTLLQYLISFWERVVMAGTIDSKTKQTLKDIANKLRIHSINSTTAAGTGWVYNTRLSVWLTLSFNWSHAPSLITRWTLLSLAHSITIECSDFSSCGNVQFQYVCFENWSISLMQNELFYLSFSHSKKDFYMYLSQVLYWLLMHISEKLCWHSFPLILISWLTMIIICTRLSKVS